MEWQKSIGIGGYDDDFDSLTHTELDLIPRKKNVTLAYEHHYVKSYGPRSEDYDSRGLVFNKFIQICFIFLF